MLEVARAFKAETFPFYPPVWVCSARCTEFTNEFANNAIAPGPVGFVFDSSKNTHLDLRRRKQDMDKWTMGDISRTFQSRNRQRSTISILLLSSVPDPRNLRMNFHERRRHPVRGGEISPENRHLCPEKRKWIGQCEPEKFLERFKVEDATDFLT